VRKRYESATIALLCEAQQARSIRMRIEIICTGDEVLSGKTINTNYSHMARRLQEVGLDVLWGTTVGDDRASLVEAFGLASKRADAVIVNGGLGPTVDDLSQEVAAQAAGVELELHEAWLERIQAFYTARGRVMPPNNRKQAMLPVGSEFIDNPVGTACGFAIDIATARFFFTPGVPREIKRMFDDEIIPRLLRLSGTQAVVALQRFHSFGLGESRVDDMLQGVEALAPEGEVKLGFQAHYPQLETKLFARGDTQAQVEARLEPVARAVREKLGAYIVALDSDTLEAGLMAELSSRAANVAIAEAGTHGAVGSRLVAADTEASIFARGVVASSVGGLLQALGERETKDQSNLAACAISAANGVRVQAGASYGLAVLVDVAQAGSGWVYIAISSVDSSISRAACFVGSAERARVGGVEMGLDCLRRVLAGLSVDDLVDFEKHNT
jgi:nicotinamide-nucleotide amidase